MEIDNNTSTYTFSEDEEAKYAHLWSQADDPNIDEIPYLNQIFNFIHDSGTPYAIDVADRYQERLLGYYPSLSKLKNTLAKLIKQRKLAVTPQTKKLVSQMIELKNHNKPASNIVIINEQQRTLTNIKDIPKESKNNNLKLSLIGKANPELEKETARDVMADFHQAAID